MGDRRPAGEKEFNPLDDALDLIGRVMEGQGVDAPQQKMHPLPSGQRTVVPTSVVDLERPKGLEHPRRLAEEEPSQRGRSMSFVNLRYPSRITSG
jgi:hypothetical protein